MAKWVGHLWLKWVGHLWLKWVGHLWLKWVGHLWLKWVGKLLFGRDMLKKNTDLQGSTISGPRMTTGFGPFELPTRGLLQKGRDHSLRKVCFEEPSFWLAKKSSVQERLPSKNKPPRHSTKTTREQAGISYVKRSPIPVVNINPLSTPPQFECS